MSDDLTDDQKAVAEVMDAMVKIGWATGSIRTHGSKMSLGTKNENNPTVRLIRAMVIAMGGTISERHQKAFFWIMCEYLDLPEDNRGGDFPRDNDPPSV